MTVEEGSIEQVREVFVEGMGRIADFWGVGRVMGRLWAVLYLSREPMTMDGLTAAVGITKGHASANLRALQRLKLVHKSWRPGDRKDYWSAETDLWSFVKEFLRNRQTQELDQALGSTARSLAILGSARSRLDAQEYAFLNRRLEAVREFHATVDRGVQALLKIDDLRGAIARLARPGGRGSS